MAEHNEHNAWPYARIARQGRRKEPALKTRLGAAALRKRKGAAWPVITAYDAPFARLAELAGIDCLLVGDSLGMVVLGYDSTIPVELADMQRHTAAVARGTQSAHIIADLPFGSYEASDADAVRAGITLIKAGAQSVKLEGGLDRAPRIAALTAAGIPVIAHLGVLPQTAGLSSGYSRKRDREVLMRDLEAVTAANATAVVLEMVEETLAAEITAVAQIPTIGIGSGRECDAQVLVMHDVLGLFENPPPFAKAYVDLRAVAGEALSAYATDVRRGRDV